MLSCLQLVMLLPAEVVERAAAAASLNQPLTFTGLLGKKLYRTAVAHLVKTSGKEPGAPQVSDWQQHRMVRVDWQQGQLLKGSSAFVVTCQAPPWCSSFSCLHRQVEWST